MDTQRCTRCGEAKPLTEFSKRSSVPSGRRSHCKECCKVSSKIYRDAHDEQIKTGQHIYNRTPRGIEYHRKWRENHPDKVKEYESKRTNVEERRTFSAQWEKLHPEYRRAKAHRRRARQKNLPDTFTEVDEQVANQYFKGQCAVCGRLPDFWHIIAMDHWIPLVAQNCPGSIPENMIPLCHSKKDAPVGWPGCNNSKNDSDPHKWLVGKFGKRKAKEVEQRVQDYVEWLKGKH